VAIRHLRVVEEDQVAERMKLLFVDARQMDGRGWDREKLTVALGHHDERPGGRSSPPRVNLMGRCESEIPAINRPVRQIQV
jgi:hypothetical protein